MGTDHGQAVRLLIVEDDGRVRRALVDLLASASGLVVVGATGDADEARTLSSGLRPQVALVDLLLPDLDTGLALVGAIHDAGTTVAAMSIRDGVRNQALAAGASAFLRKDGASDLIIDTLRRLGQNGPAREE